MIHEQLREIARDLRAAMLMGRDMDAMRRAADRLENIAAALDYTKHHKPNKSRVRGSGRNSNHPR